MQSRIETIGRRAWIFFDHVTQMRISVKITLLYAAILFIVLLITSGIMGLGIYFSFYHQAEVDITFCMERMNERLKTQPNLRDVLSQDDALLPGVVLRVTDMAGKVVMENDIIYPTLQSIAEHKVINPPIWANPNMEVSEFPHLTIYHAQADVWSEGRMYRVHFLKTITADKNFLDHLQKILFIILLMGLVLALLTGYAMSKRILHPIRAMILATRKIEVERLNHRIAVPPVHDDLRELAETFNHMLDRLETGFKQQQRFVSDASHELRTPVTVILGYSDMLSRWGRSDENVLEEGIESIRSEAEDMQQLIEKLLFLARADQNRQVLHKERVNLAKLLRDTARKLQLVTKTHGIMLLQNDEGTIFADRVMILHMIRIFLENSIKYTPEGGHITIASVRSADGKSIEVTLADDGIGIAKEDQEKIFMRFYRVDASRTKKAGSPGGTGLGLSIARWIADQHGIAIRLESELGEGTKIHLTVPLVGEADRAAADAEEKTESSA